MSLLIESIKIFNGRIYNLNRHQQRMNNSRKALFGIDIPISLRSKILIPALYHTGLIKCRIVYNTEINQITYHKYIPKPIKSVQLVYDNSIVYDHKYKDREHINQLYAQRGECDDIIIVKNGMLTDSSYCNIALRKLGKWYTPDSCLLQGTRRTQLIDQRKLIVKPIPVDTIHNYDRISLVNAMMGLSNSTISYRK